MSTTAKTVIKLLAWAYGKRRRFLAVKRAKAAVVCARLFQAHMGAYHLDHIGAIKQFLDKGLGYHGSGSIPSKASGLTAVAQASFSGSSGSSLVAKPPTDQHAQRAQP